jgi:hypothetical protein
MEGGCAVHGRGKNMLHVEFDCFSAYSAYCCCSHDLTYGRSTRETHAQVKMREKVSAR